MQSLRPRPPDTGRKMMRQNVWQSKGEITYFEMVDWKGDVEVEDNAAEFDLGHRERKS